MAYQLVYRQKGTLAFSRGHISVDLDVIVGMIEDFSSEFPNRDYGYIIEVDCLDRPR